MNKFDIIDKTINHGRTIQSEKAIARQLGIPLHMARRYFDRQCSCGKQLQGIEVSMFLITQGKYDRELNDSRQYLCKKCLSEFMKITGDEYDQLIERYANSGCQYL